ncbi:MAG: hypothetical protein U1D99_07340 [Candidatus Omnitrophota bacterium]|nr:hypothetical protein [Candidatus Omnitrophota bacterium]
MVSVSPAQTPPLLKAVVIDPKDPFKLDFIIDRGDVPLEGAALEEESRKLIKYFLAALTVPEDELWVNLSPYEDDKIIPEMFGQTEMGRDLLSQDYLLKQLTASMIYPESALGKNFWKQVYAKAQEKFGTTRIPINTFNKVWIIPDTAEVYEHRNTAYVLDNRLKVMLEGDYLARDNNLDNPYTGTGQLSRGEVTEASDLSSQIVKDIILPELEKEVNQGQNFANLRQVYHSLILAAWFKKRLKESVLGAVYVDRNKIAGVETEDTDAKDRIYAQYLRAYQEGVFHYVRDDVESAGQEPIPRKYYSGGFIARDLSAQKLRIKDNSMLTPKDRGNLNESQRQAPQRLSRVSVRLEGRRALAQPPRPPQTEAEREALFNEIFTPLNGASLTVRKISPDETEPVFRLEREIDEFTSLETTARTQLFQIFDARTNERAGYFEVSSNWLERGDRDLVVKIEMSAVSPAYENRGLYTAFLRSINDRMPEGFHLTSEIVNNDTLLGIAKAVIHRGQYDDRFYQLPEFQNNPQAIVTTGKLTNIMMEIERQESIWDTDRFIAIKDTLRQYLYQYQELAQRDRSLPSLTEIANQPMPGNDKFPKHIQVRQNAGFRDHQILVQRFSPTNHVVRMDSVATGSAEPVRAGVLPDREERRATLMNLAASLQQAALPAADARPEDRDREYKFSMDPLTAETTAPSYRVRILGAQSNSDAGSIDIKANLASRGRQNFEFVLDFIRINPDHQRRGIMTGFLSLVRRQLPAGAVVKGEIVNVPTLTELAKFVAQQGDLDGRMAGLPAFQRAGVAPVTRNEAQQIIANFESNTFPSVQAQIDANMQLRQFLFQYQEVAKTDDRLPALTQKYPETVFGKSLARSGYESNQMYLEWQREKKFFLLKFRSTVPQQTAMAEGEKGGIDLNPALLDLKIRYDERGVPLTISAKDLQEKIPMEGLAPVILKVTPVTDLPGVIGISAGETEKQEKIGLLRMNWN